MTDPIDIRVLCTHENLSVGDRDASFVVRLDPPAMPDERGPVSVILALDRSGSMAGEKLESAQRSASALIRALGHRDTFGCVFFNGVSSVVVAPTRMTAEHKAHALMQIEQVSASGNTDLAQALLKSLDLTDEASGAHVILLTDGRPTSGPTDVAQIARLAENALGACTLSTLGYGDDVDPHLLQRLADIGRGTFTVIDGPEAPLAAIGGEIGGLMRTVATAGTLRIQPADGVTLRQVYRTTGLRRERATGAAVLDLPPLVADEPVRVAFELAWSGLVPASLGTVSFRARRIDTGAVVAGEAQVLAPIRASRGAPVPEAVKHLILAQAASVISAASSATSQPANEVARGLARYGASLARDATLAGIQEDDQIVEALEMLARARHALESANPSVVKAARNQMVAASGALRALKGTLVFSEPGRHVKVSRFTTRSQIFGMDLLDKADEASRSRPRIVQDADDDEDPKGPLN